VIYRIDANDHLVFADGAFYRFADAAGVPNLPAEWLGKSIWACIADDELRSVFVALVARARAGHTMEFMTRCDSPSLKRSVSMEIAPWTDGGVEFRCRLGSASLRHPETSRCCDLLRVCAWCYRAQFDGVWRDIERVVADEHLLEHVRIPIVTHGICDACLAETAAELEALATA
jgi:hypothetical protein